MNVGLLLGVGLPAIVLQEDDVKGIEGCVFAKNEVFDDADDEESDVVGVGVEKADDDDADDGDVDDGDNAEAVANEEGGGEYE